MGRKRWREPNYAITEPGFYWVRRPSGHKEFVAEFDGRTFWADGYRDDLIVLSGRIIPPSERSAPAG